LNSVWARTLAVLAATALAGLVLWPLAGGARAWATVALVLAVIVLRHAANLAALAAWLRRPTLRNLPEGSGIWEDVLTVLHGYLKRRDTEHADAVRMLGRFHDAARALPDGVILLDAESRIVWANPTAQWHFGIDAQRDAGQPVVHLVRHPDFVAYMGRGEFDQPHGIAMDSSGRIFVADRNNNRLQIFDQDGKFLAEWRQFGRPSGVFIDKNDMIYVADSQSSDKTNPGYKQGIRVGTAKDGQLTAYIPETKDLGSLEATAADDAGNVYAGYTGAMNFKRFARK